MVFLWFSYGFPMVFQLQATFWLSRLAGAKDFVEEQVFGVLLMGGRSKLAQSAGSTGEIMWNHVKSRLFGIMIYFD